jgi:type VI secretion system secreted protein Hcp
VLSLPSPHPCSPSEEVAKRPARRGPCRPIKQRGLAMAIRKGATFTLTGIIIALILVVPSAALAADSLFLKLDGIQGESTDSVHRGEIVLLSYTQSFINPGGAAAQPNCGAITVTKVIDRSSPALIGVVLRGNRIPTGVITFRHEGGLRLEYYKVTLTDVLINAISQTDASPTDPTTILEQISMNASTLRFEYTPQLPTGSPGPIVAFGWNCATNRAQ